MAQVVFRDIVKKEIAGASNVHDFLKGKSIPEVKEWCKPRLKNFSVCTLSLTGELNIGVITRVAHCFGTQAIYIIGRRRFDKRSTVGAHAYTNVVQIDALDSDQEMIESGVFFDTMDQNNLFPIFVEIGGDDLGSFTWTKRLEGVDKQPCFVFGSEGDGIPLEILESAERYGSFVVTIPQYGAIRSLNVSSAASIVLWDYVKEFTT